ncbi:MAG: ribose 5-phosphate isomerase A [Bacteroidetes Order II. Incertae sedis bacterium]|nr:ribose 5-phosphate isomerase A [Bacteroidetes Order II. bacterium]
MISPKQRAGEAAAALIVDGMNVGLGTGSTTAFAIEALGQRIREEGLRIRGVPTSFFAERLARQSGIPLISLDEIATLDLAFDGADEVDPAFNLIKGRGAAHTREKVVAAQAKRFVVLVDDSKMVEKLGLKMPLPIEVLPMALGPITRALENMGALPELRMGLRKDGPVVSDQGFWVVDAIFPEGLPELDMLNQTLLQMPGILDHGLFLHMATDVLIGHENGQLSHQKRPV